MRARITQLREQRARNFERIKEINDLAVKEQRNLAAEETEEYRKLEASLDEDRNEIDRLERALGFETTINKPPAREDVDLLEEDEVRKLPESWQEFILERRVAAGDPLAQQRKAAGTAEYRNAWFSLLASQGEYGRLGEEEKRALSTAPGPEGGFTVPTTTEATLVERRNQFSPILTLATVITTGSGETLKLPLEADLGTAAWTAVNVQRFFSDVVFGVLQLGAFTLTRVIAVPVELLQDTVVDLEAYIARAFGRSFGLAEGSAYVAGDGVGKPTGFVAGSQIGKTVAAPAAGQAPFGGDDIIDLLYSVLAPYRANGTWLGNDRTLADVRKLKDLQGRYLWQMSLADGQPDLLLGKPIYSEPFLADPTHGQTIPAKPLIFGDMSYVVIRRVAGVVMQRLNEVLRLQGQIGFLMEERSDSGVTQPEAIKALSLT